MQNSQTLGLKILWLSRPVHWCFHCPVAASISAFLSRHLAHLPLAKVGSLVRSGMYFFWQKTSPFSVFRKHSIKRVALSGTCRRPWDLKYQKYLKMVPHHHYRGEKPRISYWARVITVLTIGFRLWEPEQIFESLASIADYTQRRVVFYVFDKSK